MPDLLVTVRFKNMVVDDRVDEPGHERTARREALNEHGIERFARWLRKAVPTSVTVRNIIEVEGQIPDDVVGAAVLGRHAKGHFYVLDWRVAVESTQVVPPLPSTKRRKATA